MFESWKVMAIVYATSNVARVMGDATRATLLTNSELSKQQTILNRRAAQEAALRQQLQKTQAVARVATAGFTALSVVTGAAIYTGVKGAADLEQAMMSVAIATGRATNNMSDFYQLAFKVSGATAQSVTTIAQELATAASSGLRDPNLLKTAFPLIARAADVLWLSPKHLDPVDSVRQMSTMAHLFGQYQGAGLQRMLDRAVQLMYMQPENLQSVITQGRLFIGPALARGVTTEDIFQQILAMGQTGNLRSRGGSGLANVIEYLSGASSITAHLSKARRAAFQDLGVWDASGQLKFKDEKGNLLLGKAVDYLFKIQHNYDPSRFAGDLRNAFGAQGSRYLLTILRPSVHDQYKKNWAAMNQVGGVEVLWKKYTNMFWYQWNVFATNFQNIAKTVFLPLLPRFTQYLRDAGNALGNAVMYLSKHPKQAKMIGEGLLTTFAASVVGIGATSVIAAANVWRLNAALTALSVSSGTGGAARVGLIGGIGSFLGSLFSGSMLRSVVLSLLLRGGPIASIVEMLIGGLSRLVPIVGWVALIVGAINLLSTAIQKLPHLIAVIHNWWVRNREAIGYTIGYVFGSIGRMLQSAISELLAGAQGAIGAFAQNSYLLLTPGGNVQLAAIVAAAQAQAQKDWERGNHPTFGTGFGTGLNDGSGGKQYAPHGHAPTGAHVEFHNPVFNFGPGTTPAQADAHGKAFGNGLLRALQGPLGTVPTSPVMSRFSVSHY